MSKHVSFQGGTLVLYNVDGETSLPRPFLLVKERWRCEGYHYGSIQPYLQEEDIHDAVPRWKALNLTMQDTREAHDYQLEALVAWNEAGCCGSIVLPTGRTRHFWRFWRFSK